MKRALLLALAVAATQARLPRARAEGAPTTVSAGFSHSCGVRADGLFCWGANDSGQLGIGAAGDQLTATHVVGTSNIIHVSAGDLFTCALRIDHTLWCWGNDVAGQIGDGSTDDAFVPIRVSALGNDVVDVSAGDLFACARKGDGTLWCWGAGFLGNGNGDGSLIPVQVTSLGSAVVEVSTGDATTCARKSDGTLWCWGDNEFGAIGDGTRTDALNPTAVTALGSTVAQVSVGDLFACARKSDGTAWCWGTNDHGQIGDGTTTDRLTPVQVAALGTSVAEISANGRHACARKTDGTLWCWGANGNGELGDGTVVDRSGPVKVSGLPAVAEVSAGVNHDTCARTTDGRIWCWGLNVAGQLGDGTVTGRRTPVPVVGFSPTLVPSGSAAGAAALALLLVGLAAAALRRTARA